MIMKKAMLKRILGLFVLIFVCSFTLIPTVYAAKCTVVKDYEWADRYGITAESPDGNELQIKMKKESEIEIAKSIKKNKEKIKFKVVEIKNYSYVEEKDKKGNTNGKIVYDESKTLTGEDAVKEISSNRKNLTPNTKITIDVADLRKNKGYGKEKKVGYEVKLEAVDFSDPGCTGDKKEFNIVMRLEIYGGDEVKTAGYKIEEGDQTTTAQINCDNYETEYASDKFKYLFCEGKVKAKEQIDFGTGNFSDKFSQPATFKCSWKDFVENKDWTLPEGKVQKESDEKTKTQDDSGEKPKTQEELDEEYYSYNKGYLYGYSIKERDTITYEHNYENGNTATTPDQGICKLKCEESVIIEYGPPVASKAGLCFEYKVKVTSRVSCYQAEKIKYPDENKYCTPAPLCVSSNGQHVYNQGGPNDDFDNCVKKCDGGKYTDKCSQKCYKKVYSNNKNSKTSSSGTQYADKLSKSNPQYRWDGNQIIWDNGLNGGNDIRDTSANVCGSNWHYSKSPDSCTTDSVWHRTHEWGTYGPYSRYTATGIPKEASCTDNCYWIGCRDGGLYLNKETAEKANEKNVADYKALVESCKAAASCSSTTAIFTISVDYKYTDDHDKTQIGTIDFPYSKAKTDRETDTILNDTGDKLYSLGIRNSGKSNSVDDQSTILKYGGCYNDAEQKNWYLTEWSFPGTWLNNKHQNISYTPRRDSGWKAYPKKFCVPLNALDVNKKWWLTYYGHAIDKKFKNYSYENLKAMEDYGNCKGKSSKILNKLKQAKNASYKETDFDWNIRAYARKFGLFEWDINIKCFYALYGSFAEICDCDDPPCKKKDTCENPPCDGDNDGGGNVKYSSRPVALDDLFPSADGTKPDPGSTGRTPAFNWSEYATQEKKDAAYISQPSAYTKWVQKNNYSIYSDEYIDYEVILSKKDIAELRSKGKNYTDYSGEATISSTTNYRSPLFANGGTLAGGKNVYPNGEALKCNNIGTHDHSSGYSAKCETFK